MAIQTTQKKLPEQTAKHVYNNVPARASMATTQEPPASRHYAGHYAGIHPEDTPRTTADQPAPGRSQTRIPIPADDEDNGALYPQRPPSSARRYKPNVQESPRFTPRKTGHAKGFYTLIVGCGVMAGITIASIVPPLWQWGSDQLNYGYPRTYQTDRNVGHYPGNKDPRSHFIALNNHGYIEVIELPKGVPVKPEDMRLSFVSLPANEAADQAPVTLDFEDINGDGKLDMEVSCNNNKTIFYNDGHGFKENS